MAFPTTSILDTFDRADGAVGSNYTIVSGGFNVASNLLAGTNTGANEMYWNVNQFEKDQEAYITISTLPGTGKAVSFDFRYNGFVSPSGYYTAYTDAATDTQEIFRVDAGVDTRLGAANTGNFTAGDIYGSSVIGNVITFYKNGTALFSRTDSTYSNASYIGIYIDGTTGRLNDFGGGTTRLKSLPIFKRKQQVWPRRF